MKRSECTNWPRSTLTNDRPTRAVHGFHAASAIIHSHASRSVNASGAKTGWSKIPRSTAMKPRSLMTRQHP
jgi:hypothetical protein